MRKITKVAAFTALVTILMTSQVLAATICSIEKKDDRNGFCYQKTPGKAWLGVDVVDGKLEGIVDVEHGAMIADIADQSPLKDTGLGYGDLIIKFNGKDVKSAQDLKASVLCARPGDEVTITTVTLNCAYQYKYNDFTVKLACEPKKRVDL